MFLCWHRRWLLERRCLRVDVDIWWFPRCILFLPGGSGSGVGHDGERMGCKRYRDRAAQGKLPKTVFFCLDPAQETSYQRERVDIYRKSVVGTVSRYTFFQLSLIEPYDSWLRAPSPLLRPPVAAGPPSPLGVVVVSYCCCCYRCILGGRLLVGSYSHGTCHY